MKVNDHMHRFSIHVVFVLLTGLTIAFAQPSAPEYARLAQAYQQWIQKHPALHAYWSFDEHLNDQTGEYPGELYGGILTHFSGPIAGGSVSLEDGRFLAIANDDGSLDLPQVTFELFFRPTAKPSSPKHNPTVFAQREKDTRISVHLNANLQQLLIWNGKQLACYTLPVPVAINQWQHLVVSADGDGYHVWLDGQAATVTRAGGGLNTTSEKLPLYLTASGKAGGEPMFAQVSDFAVYNRRFTDKDVADHLATANWPAVRTRRTAALAREQEQQRKELAAQRRQRWQKKFQERWDDPVLFARGQTKIYRDDYLNAISVPLGGFGAGCIQMNGAAELAVWQIFNNYSQARVRHSFFAVRAQVPGDKTQVRALQTTPISGFPAMEQLEFIGEFPFALYQFRDSKLPVDVSLRAYNPFIPMDLKNSAIPCIIFDLTATNNTALPVKVSFLASQQNAVGFTGRDEAWARSGYKGNPDKSPALYDSGLWQDFGGNRNRVRRTASVTQLHMTADLPPEDEAFGDMVLMTTADNAVGCASWTSETDLSEYFTQTGKVKLRRNAGPTAQGKTLQGALVVPFTLQPNENRTVTFVLTWHFPTYHRLEWWEYTDWQDRDPGNYYATMWKSALDVGNYVATQLPYLEAATERYHSTFYAANLPHWLLDRINSQNAILQSKTMGWSESNWITGNEGTNALRSSCPYNNLYVWGYAQSHARLFPEIARRMREQEFIFQHDNGKINTRLSNSHDLASRDYPAAFDAMCFNVLGAYREHLLSTNDAWLKQWWPHIAKSMEYVIQRWDADENGVMSGPVMGNTLDCHLSGVSSWLGTLYLAALEATEKMAEIAVSDVAAQRYRSIHQSGALRQDEIMWNSSYYVQKMDREKWGRADYGDGVAIDMLLGEWWADQVGLGPYYPQPHRRSALHAVLTHNFRPDFLGIEQSPRKFVDDNDAGLQMITWPEGTSRPERFTAYSDEVMSGFEYSYAAACIQNGLLHEGLLVARAAYERYDGRLRLGLSAGDNNAWGYSGNPFGDDEAGKFYSRALTVWSILLALQGFDYDGPQGIISFQPVWQPQDHASFFSTAQGWGLFQQQRSPGRQRETLTFEFGELTLREMIFTMPEKTSVVDAKVTVNGVPLASRLDQRDVGVHIHITGVALHAGDRIEVTITYAQ